MEVRMKKIEKQRRYFPAKLAVVFSLALCAFFVWGMIGQAAEKTLLSAEDYLVKVVEESADECKIQFTPSKTASFVIIHYKLNNGDQQNINMTENGGVYEKKLEGVTAGDMLAMSFTYSFEGGVQYDTAEVTHEIGSLSESGSTVSAVRIEAEDYTKMSGVEKGTDRLTGIDTNDWMRYTVNVEAAGTYQIVAHAKADGTKDGVFVFRDAQKKLAAVTVTKGGTELADYRSGQIKLQEGELQLTVIAVSGALSVDWFELEPVSGSTEEPGEDTENPGGDTENPGWRYGRSREIRSTRIW